MKSLDKMLADRVIKTINECFGDDVTKLRKVNEYEADFEEKKARLETRLDHANSSVSHEIQDLLNSGDKLEKRVSDLTAQQDSLLIIARETAEHCRRFSTENRELLTDISCVRGVTQYTLWLRLVEQVSLDLSVSLETRDKDQIINAYKKMQDVRTALQESKCENLKKYVDETVEHWHKIVTQTYTTSLQSSLDLFNWPFIESLENSKKSIADLIRIGSDDIRALRDSIELLLLVQHPAEQGEKFFLNLPMRVLMKPLRKRFKFHFLGTKSTNNPSKPEWFVTQLSTWAMSHRQFLTEYVQPAYDRVGSPIFAIREFAQGLVCLAVDKLCVDIPIVVEDDILFAHTIDEAIGLARDMSNIMQYSSSQPSVLQPLTTQGIFSRWLNMERKFAFEKVDNLFMEQGTSVWESEVGDSLTPRAAETFLALLLSVTERYKFLSDSHHRLEFLKLQLDLIEDFRVRLVQLARTEKKSPLSSNLCPILNTLEHLILVLGNWAETPFFLNLQFQKSNVKPGSGEDLEQRENTKPNPDSGMENTVFEDSIEELEYLRENLINEVVESIYYTITARSLKYRTETKWFSMSDSGKTISPKICEMLQSLAFGLDAARRRINPAAFQLVWRNLADRLHSFIIQEIILSNKFCIEGAEQLDFDMKTGVFPIFGEFSKFPQSYFPQLVDALKLLKSCAGPLVLAYQGLLDTCETGAINILADLGIQHLTRDRACLIISTRIDLEL
ncbi:RAD50-interacting protein 1 [Eurytemora carolleeae]|uniref:RAD50-interacting protein 1 n=1 Tax=Eurytemora carolleeae TaxID=1294199 RepID=UPI000C7848B5|nr:RAD50-interacting protein 1 [Eurytemora carolleeae]|eukprot:XP_023330399.1 RAD50-interacting protein 1-like [Eurytemora affinis]